MSSTSSVVPSSVAGESASGLSYRHQRGNVTVAELQEASVNIFVLFSLLTVSFGDLQKLAERQAEVDALYQQLKELTSENAKLRMTLVGKKTNIDVSAEEKLEKTIVKCGKYHHAFYSFTVSREFFGHPVPERPSSDPIRCVGDAQELQANIAEIFECTPTEFHGLFAGKVGEVIETYFKAVYDGRSSALNKVKKQRALIFPQVGAVVFKEADSDKVRLSASPVVQRMLGMRRALKDGSWSIEFLDKNFLVFPPLLYKDFDAKNVNSAFMSSTLIEIARIILSTDSGDRGNNTYKHPDGRTNHTTPGLVAWCAVVATYFLSDDVKFSGGPKEQFVGHRSSRPYLYAFSQYKHYLIQHQTNARAVFKLWDSALFPVSENEEAETIISALTGPSTDAPIDSPLAELLRRQATITADDEMDSEPEDFAPPGSIDRPYSRGPSPFDDMYYNPAPVTSDPPVRAPAAPPAPLIPSPERRPNTIVPSRSLSASEFVPAVAPLVVPTLSQNPSTPEVAPAVAPAAAPIPAPARKNARRGRQPAALQADGTVVPRPTRRSNRNT